MVQRIRMSSLQEFDIRSRGVVNLVDEWEIHHADVRKIWKVEDLIGIAKLVIEKAKELHAHYAQHGEFPTSTSALAEKGDFDYFVHLLRTLLRAATKIEDRASVHESEGYSIRGADELRAGIRDIVASIEAYDAEVREWSELDKQALSSDDFKALAAHLIATGKAST